MKLIAGILALAAFAAPVHAQGFEASRLTIDFYNFDQEGDGATYATALGDTSYLFLPRAGLQIGIGGSAQITASSEEFEDDTEYALSLHGFYDVTPDMRLALLLGVDTYNDVDYLAAVEGIYAAGPIRAEARLGSYASDIAPAGLIEVLGSYFVTPQIDLRVSYQRLTYEDDTGYFSLASVGSGYSLTDTVTAYATYGITTNDFGDEGSFDGSQISLGVNIAIGSLTNPKLSTFNPFF